MLTEKLRAVTSRARRATGAVLLLTKESAEWFETLPDGTPRHAVRPVLGSAAEDFAHAAHEAAEAAGATTRACVLALGHGLVELRSLSLPELPAPELSRVFPRRAAAVLEAEPRDILYTALPFAPERKTAGGSGDGAPASEQRWLLVAVRRAFATQLTIALRRASFRPRRAVAARLARLSTAERLRSERPGACIVLDVGTDSVVVSLIAEGSLVHQGRLSGSFETVPTMALALIQEIKSFEGYWRKSSRGAGVASVVVIGLDLERAPLFKSAVANAVPEAEVVLAPGEGSPYSAGSSRAHAGRYASLEACLGTGPFDVDLSVAMPARYSYVITLGVSLVLVTGGLGTVIHGRIAQDRAALEARSNALEIRTADLESLRRRNAEAEAAVEDLRRECERLRRLGTIGVPLDEALRHTFGALAGRGALMTLSAKGAGDEGFRIGAIADAEPMAATRALTEVGTALERSELFTAVQVVPPEMAQGAANATDVPLAFEVRAQWEVVE